MYDVKSLNNQPLLIRPTFIDFSSSELCYYQFVVSLVRWNESCNALDNLNNR